MSKTYRSNGPRVAIHLPLGVVNSLKHIASVEDRSVASQARRFIIAAVEKWEEEDAAQYYVQPEDAE